MSWTPIHCPAFIAGEAVETRKILQVRFPYDGTLTGTASVIAGDHLESAIQAALCPKNATLTRHQRSCVLRDAAQAVRDTSETFARLMTRETGLALMETRQEVTRTADLLDFAAMEALRDDGQVYSGDITASGKSRRLFTTRYPVDLIAAITPFNHPLNQIAHKLAPAIAAGAAVILKPSERAPLTALRFAELLYRAGLPGWMLSMFLGELDDVIQPMIIDPRTEVVSFTGSVVVGKEIARRAGYKKICLELGGNSPLIVLADADLDLAAKLACEGSFRNSGQRCTAVKRILVVPEIQEEFTEKFVALAQSYLSGDPENEATMVGTVITETAAELLERRVHNAVALGAKVLLGGGRRGALLEPTILTNVPRDAEVVAQESFGPLAPIVSIADLDDAIRYYNGGRCGLSAAVVTEDLGLAMRAAKELKTGIVNINEVPAYRLEHTPFGGVRDSGLGLKEGITEAMKFFTHVKTISLPW